jgi:hypothetical protein
MAIHPGPNTSVSASSIQLHREPSPAEVSSSSCSEPTNDGKSLCKNLRTLLPVDFKPTPYSVVCGRGRKCAESVGNRRLNVTAQMFIPRYSQATRKEEKSLIVTEILELVRDACPNERHAFLRFTNGQWWEAENLSAREKVGTVLRDSLHSKYRSSTKSKLARRKERKEARKAQISVDKSICLDIDLDQLSDDSSALSGEELEMDNIFS